MRTICATIIAGLAVAAGAAVTPAAAETPEKNPRFVSGLICDTREQAERFVMVLRDDVDKALGAVNTEAGTPDACMVATYGFVPGQTVSEVERNGSIVDVIEINVMAVATTSGLQMIEPKIFYSVVPTRDRIA